MPFIKKQVEMVDGCKYSLLKIVCRQSIFTAYFPFKIVNT